MIARLNLPGSSEAANRCLAASATDRDRAIHAFTAARSDTARARGSHVSEQGRRSAIVPPTDIDLVILQRPLTHETDAIWVDAIDDQVWVVDAAEVLP